MLALAQVSIYQTNAIGRKQAIDKLLLSTHFIVIFCSCGYCRAVSSFLLWSSKTNNLFSKISTGQYLNVYVRVKQIIVKAYLKNSTSYTKSWIWSSITLYIYKITYFEFFQMIEQGKKTTRSITWTINFSFAYFFTSIYGKFYLYKSYFIACSCH